MPENYNPMSEYTVQTTLSQQRAPKQIFTHFRLVFYLLLRTRGEILCNGNAGY